MNASYELSVPDYPASQIFRFNAEHLQVIVNDFAVLEQQDSFLEVLSNLKVLELSANTMSSKLWRKAFWNLNILLKKNNKPGIQVIKLFFDKGLNEHESSHIFLSFLDAINDGCCSPSLVKVLTEYGFSLKDVLDRCKLFEFKNFTFEEYQQPGVDGLSCFNSMEKIINDMQGYWHNLGCSDSDIYRLHKALFFDRNGQEMLLQRIKKLFNNQLSVLLEPKMIKIISDSFVLLYDFYKDFPGKS